MKTKIRQACDVKQAIVIIQQTDWFQLVKIYKRNQLIYVGWFKPNKYRASDILVKTTGARVRAIKVGRQWTRPHIYNCTIEPSL